MSRGAPPLRFILLVLGGWTAFRVAVLVPGWSDGEGPRQSGEPAMAAAPDTVVRHSPRLDEARRWRKRIDASTVGQVRLARGGEGGTQPGLPVAAPDQPVPAADPLGPPDSFVPFASPVPPPFAPPTPATRRWSVSAWAFVRRGGDETLATGGLLGGSQIGGRINYRLNHDREKPLSLSFRTYAPLQGKGAEAALGMEWKPLAALPLRLLAERRQGLDAAGRSAFALMALGGGSVAPGGGRVRIDAYGQAGMVGLHSRDLFADGSVVAGVPIGREGEVELGGGAWGAAQPGVARFDIGPRVRWRLPVPGAYASLAAEWRFRIVGEVTPQSGPALTFATDF